MITDQIDKQLGRWRMFWFIIMIAGMISAVIYHYVKNPSFVRALPLIIFPTAMTLAKVFDKGVELDFTMFVFAWFVMLMPSMMVALYGYIKHGKS